MSFFNTTATLEHRTPLPPSVTFKQAITLLRDHDYLIRLDPELAKYDQMTPPPNANPKTKFYSITDHMEALPLGLWGTTVNFKAEMTDTETGIEWIIRAPMGLVQTSHWTIEPAGLQDGIGEEKGKGLVLVERVLIAANMLLVKTVKGKCMENYKGIHKKFADTLAERPLSAKVADVAELVTA